MQSPHGKPKIEQSLILTVLPTKADRKTKQAFVCVVNMKQGNGSLSMRSCWLSSLTLTACNCSRVTPQSKEGTLQGSNLIKALWNATTPTRAHGMLKLWCPNSLSVILLLLTRCLLAGCCCVLASLFARQHGDGVLRFQSMLPRNS